MATRLGKVVQAFANDGRHVLDETSFKGEGRYPTGIKGGSSEMVFAFKAYQARLYGCIDEARKAFVCLNFDQKKSNKANQDLLRDTAKGFGTYLEEMK